jgi:pyridoxamine 5'-phosphate oxidase
MVQKIDISSLRVDYTLAKFNEEDVNPDPFKQFAAWFADALNAKVNEPNAMTLSTVNEHGKPSSRIVLLKSFDKKGFVFFTNYDSTKGKHIANQPAVALNFCWLELQRQVRIEGIATKISVSESDSYFHSRPFESQLGAHASAQSSIIKGRAELESNYEATKIKFSNTEIYRPENWGGYLVNAKLIEFWQGRSNRLHDRIEFELIDKQWHINRLSP